MQAKFLHTVSQEEDSIEFALTRLKIKDTERKEEPLHFSK